MRPANRWNFDGERERERERERGGGGRVRGRRGEEAGRISGGNWQKAA